MLSNNANGKRTKLWNDRNYDPWVMFSTIPGAAAAAACHLNLPRDPARAQRRRFNFKGEGGVKSQRAPAARSAQRARKRGAHIVAPNGRKFSVFLSQVVGKQKNQQTD